jgi:hypothetical protein
VAWSAGFYCLGLPRALSKEQEVDKTSTSWANGVPKGHTTCELETTKHISPFSQFISREPYLHSYTKFGTFLIRGTHGIKIALVDW